MLPVLFALVCTALPAWGLRLAARNHHRSRAWTPTTGNVTRLRTVSGADVASGTSGASALVADYEYLDRGGLVHQGRGRTGSRAVPVGEGPRPIELMVDPDNPSESVIVGPGSDLLFATLCLAFLVVGIIMTLVTIARW